MHGVIAKARSVARLLCGRAGKSLRHRPLVWVAAGLLLMMVYAWQLTYPATSSLPFARLNGEMVGHTSADVLRQKLRTDYGVVPLKIVVANKSYSTTSTEVGMRANEDAVIAGLTNYPVWQRLVPFSLLIAGIFKEQPVTVELDEARSTEYATARSKDCTVAPKDAGVVVRNGKAELDEAKNGQACTAVFVQDALRRATLYKGGLTIALHPAVVKPSRSDADVLKVLAQAQSLIGRKIVLSALGKETAVSQADITSWLVFSHDKKTNDIKIDTDEAKIKDYLVASLKKTYIGHGTINIYTTDGVETNQVIGSGSGVDVAATAAELQKQLRDGDGTVKAKLVALRSATTYIRSYTATQAGLQALMKDIVNDKGNYAIALQTMGGAVSVNVNGSEKYHPASTYKMYVGWAIIKRVASGQMRWTDAATNGQTVSQCFDAMIINSDNVCGEWLGEQIGWENLNTMLKEIGLTCTNLATAWYSCANDESLFLYKLQSGKILSSDQADRLLRVMKQQVYRSGIPAGVGVPVADKVGFLNGMLHDAAIVYGAHGTYVLTIMTDGSSWGQIADAARQIQAQLTKMGM